MPSTILYIFLLQWGHNVLAVEREAPATATRREPTKLQWGHNVLAVERAAGSDAMHARSWCFNGATTYSLWKAESPSVWDVERLGFNGATTYSLWKVEQNSCIHAQYHCFNGATTYSLWKELLAYHMAGLLLSLQWGHNVLAVESPHIRLDSAPAGKLRRSISSYVRYAAHVLLHRTHATPSIYSICEGLLIRASAPSLSQHITPRLTHPSSGSQRMCL